MHLVRLLPGLLRALDMLAGSGKHRVYLSWCPSRASLGGGWREGCRRATATGEGVKRQGGEVPEEDESHPPRAAQGAVTCHGKRAAYPRNGRPRKRVPCPGEVAGMADLPSQGVWAEASGTAVEPAVLPRSRMPAIGASLARDEAATAASGGT